MSLRNDANKIIDNAITSACHILAKAAGSETVVRIRGTRSYRH